MQIKHFYIGGVNLIDIGDGKLYQEIMPEGSTNVESESDPEIPAKGPQKKNA